MEQLEISQGWPERVALKSGVAASAGLLGGWIYAVLQSGPPKRWAFASSASCAICVGTFAVLQELVRRIRCDAGPTNSIVAGGTAAYLLSNIHFRNHQKALAMAVASAGGAGLADLSFSALNIPSRLRDLLIAMDLLDGQEEKEEQPTVKRKFSPEELQESWQSMAYHHTGTWRDYLPIRKLSEEEWELYQQKKAQKFQDRIDKITKPPEENS